MSVSIKLDTRELDRLIKDTGINSAAVIRDLAYQLEAEAKQLSPVDTGAMRASIFTEMQPGKEPVARVGPTVEYAVYVELGHKTSRGRFIIHPFMVPAAEEIARRFNSGATWQRIFNK